jgi:RNase P/RNase MRP subunit p30
MPTARHIKKAGLLVGMLATLSLVVLGYVLYPENIYTPEETYQVAVLCKNPLPGECEILESIVSNISNFAVQKNFSNKQKSKVDFIFVLDRKTNHYYDAYITNNKDKLISKSYFSNSSHSDNLISKEIVFLTLHSIGYQK